MLDHVHQTNLQFRGSMRPVALSLASGSVSSLLVAVARDLARTNWEHPIVPDICPLVLPEDRPFVDLKSVIVRGASAERSSTIPVLLATVVAPRSRVFNPRRVPTEVRLRCYLQTELAERSWLAPLGISSGGAWTGSLGARAAGTASNSRIDIIWCLLILKETTWRLHDFPPGFLK